MKQQHLCWLMRKTSMNAWSRINLSEIQDNLNVRIIQKEDKNVLDVTIRSL